MNVITHHLVRILGNIKRRMYKGDRPGTFTRAIIRVDARLFASGVLVPRQAATLTVVGRTSGRRISVPVAVVESDGEAFLVSMLGSQAQWVQNVRAAGGHARLARRGRESDVTLDEVPVEQRAPILRHYLDIAPGARPHVPVDRSAPLSEFEKIAHLYPVFRVG